jgi:ubiquinone/menaquinone biosynthesis C-methylase UbiE
MKDKEHGDFTGLAANYSAYRPAYSETVLTALLAIIKKQTSYVDFADIGAGTGIWSRMVARRNVKTAVAIEPNDEMRAHGIKDSEGMIIEWKQGKGEETGLESSSVDMLTMASSFHWVDFEAGTKEFARVLRDGGRFTALWNPRYIEANPLLVEIEDHLKNFLDMNERVSSGRSGITSTLLDDLSQSPYFDDVLYIEGRHTIKQTPEEYVGVWWSVNDIRVQVGEENFKRFMGFVEEIIQGMDFIETTYLTRAWTARKA